MAELFGKYQLERKLAVGGMAEIFLATYTGPEGFKKNVAIKRILPHLTEDQDFVTMFLDEARLAARFSHPNIVQIFELGQVKGNFFVAMEYVHGLSCSKVLKECSKKKVQLPLEYGAKIISFACEGLEYAHSFTDSDGTPLSLIHRDVSPQNLMLTYDGVIKVLDFGIAKAARNLYQTRSSTLKGKAAYMSPEQISQKTGLDKRSDIFSLGIVLYEFVTGQRPYQGDTELEIMMSIVQGVPTHPQILDPSIPDELCQIIDRAMSKDRDTRYQSCRELRADLEQFLINRKVYVDSYALGAFLRELVPPGDAGVGYAQATPSRPEIAKSDEDSRARPKMVKPGRTPSPAAKAMGEDAPTVLTPSQLFRLTQATKGEDNRETVEMSVAAAKGKTPPRGAGPVIQPAAIHERATLVRAGESPRRKLILGVVIVLMFVVIGAASAFLFFGNAEDNGRHATEPLKPTADPGPAVGRPIDKPDAGSGPAALGQQASSVDAGQVVALAADPGPAASAPDAGSVSGPDLAQAVAINSRTLTPEERRKQREEERRRKAEEDRKRKEEEKRRKEEEKKKEEDRKREEARQREEEKKIREAEKQKTDGGTAVAVAVVAPDAKGLLQVFSKPWTDVSIDGISYGITPLEGGIELSPGSHSIELKNQGFGISYKQNVQVLSGQTQRIQKNFQQGFLMVFANPFGEVFVNGTSKGMTPLDDPIPLYEGIQTLRVFCKATGHTVNQTIKIEAGKTLTLKLDMH